MRAAAAGVKGGAMSTHKEAMPHAELEELFAEVFFVKGTTRPSFMGMDWQFSRNMTVVRDGKELTLINTVRLDDAGLRKLDALGTVKHIVKLGAFHGMDDAFYRERYAATQWALPRMEHDGGHTTDEELVENSKMPFGGASVFAFASSLQPEGLLILERDGGILISCDSLQNWAEVDRFFSDESAKKMTEFGFIQAANIGPGWRMACKPEAADFERLTTLSFKHLVPAHGEPLRDAAHARLSERFAKEFGA
jgi:hypothetical protein